MMVVPEGTTITFYSVHGQPISNQLGQRIDQQKVDFAQFRVTYYPGNRIPNYALLPPLGLRVLRAPGVTTVQVNQPTSLRDLVRPGMGSVYWSACREIPGVEVKAAEVVETRKK